MKKTLKIKLTVDLLMMVLLLALMMFQVVEEENHRWLGILMMGLCLLHNILNGSWYKNLFRGKYPLYRIYSTIINGCVLLTLFAQMVSGMIMSRHVFTWLVLPGKMAWARLVHLACAYWGFAFLSMHLGMHGKMIQAVIQKSMKLKNSKAAKSVIQGVLALISLAGAFFIHKNNLLSYMLVQSEFVFFDYSQPAFHVLTEYACMMVFWALLSYWLSEACRHLQHLKNKVGK